MPISRSVQKEDDENPAASTNPNTSKSKPEWSPLLHIRDYKYLYKDLKYLLLLIIKNNEIKAVSPSLPPHGVLSIW